MISEQDFPIQNAWMIKSILGIFFTSAFISVYTWARSDLTSLGLWIGVGIGVLFFVISMIALILTKNNYRYSLGDEYLSLAQGVIKKQERNIPYSVLQNISIRQTLFDQLLGLASLRIENAAAAGQNATRATGQRQQNPRSVLGFMGNVVSIPGLKKADAEKLKELVLAKMESHPADVRSGL